MKKKVDYISLGLVGVALVFALALLTESFPIRANRTYDTYKDELFDPSYVHEIDIFIEDREEFFEKAADKDYVRADVIIDGKRISNVGIRTKGNNSLSLVEKYGLKRHSLKVEFDHYEDGKTYYGLDKVSLDSSFQDNAYMKNMVAMDMMGFLKVPTPLTSYTKVRINDEPYGLFLAIEEIEEGFAKRNFGLDFGQIYKASYRSLDEANYDIKLIYSGDDPKAYRNFFENAKFPTNRDDKTRLIRAIKILNKGEDLGKYIDIDQVLRCFVVLSFTANFDSYFGMTSHNYFLYEKDGRISMLPWDFNLAFATYPLASPNPTNDPKLFINFPYITPNRGEIMKNRPLFHVLMKDEKIFKRYKELYDYFIREYFESGYFDKMIKEKSQMIAPYVKADPTAFIDYEDHKKGVKAFYSFNKLRARSIRGQLDGKIPATIRDQRKREDLLIDPGDLEIEDMGEVEDLRDGYR